MPARRGASRRVCAISASASSAGESARESAVVGLSEIISVLRISVVVRGQLRECVRTLDGRCAPRQRASEGSNTCSQVGQDTQDRESQAKCSQAKCLPVRVLVETH